MEILWTTLRESHPMRFYRTKVTRKPNTCITNCIKACGKIIFFRRIGKSASQFSSLAEAGCCPTMVTSGHCELNSPKKSRIKDNHRTKLCRTSTGHCVTDFPLDALGRRIRGNCLQTARCLLHDSSLRPLEIPDNLAESYQFLEVSIHQSTLPVRSGD